MTEALEYPTEDNFPNPFKSEFISATAREFKVDPAVLEEALAAAAYDYAFKSFFSRRRHSWRAARVRFQDTCWLLKKSLASWQKASQQTKDAFASFGFNPNFDQSLAKMISDLEEILEFSSRHRGNPGKARKTPDIDLDDFFFPVMVLDEFWVEQKGRHLGHGFLAEEEPNGSKKKSASKHGKFVRKSADGDAGLLFAHACLKELNPTITRSITSSIIRKVKTHLKHFKT